MCHPASTVPVHLPVVVPWRPTVQQRPPLRMMEDRDVARRNGGP